MSKPNIIWITVESTRADHTSIDGSGRDTTPAIRRLAEHPRGRAFSASFSHGIWTLASSASILTGTYPSHHRTGMDREVIPDDLVTVPELLSAVGYRTACLSPNAHVSAATGLDRGFDRFAWINSTTLLRTVGPRAILKYLRHVLRYGDGLSTETARYGTGYMMTDLAKRWVREFAGGEEPFFLYAHYGDPHHPYHPPRRVLRRFADAFDLSIDDARDLGMYHSDGLHRLIARGCPFTDAQWEALAALYDAEIRYTDERIGELVDHVRSLGLDDTIFVVTADHGELFGERGMLAHMVVTDDAVSHVPLVVHGFDEILDHGSNTVQHIDLVRTLLEHVGARTDTLQGIDLRTGSRSASIVQRGADRFEKKLGLFAEHDPSFDSSRYHTGTVTAVRTPHFKYVRGEDDATLALLPDEETDVSDAFPGVARALDAELDRFLAGDGRHVDSEERSGSYTAAMKRQLSSLGYITD